ncbi:MAG: DUF5343 domain-containing protein [Phycisphaerales bacterium]|nr:DUF5343 domain-containing protein [Phycisphaerales bacterium]
MTMALTTAYLVSAKNLGSFLDALRSAQAPKKFTISFLEQLGFKSTNDRLFLPMLKGLGLLDQQGVPTQRYFDFLDGTQSKRVLAAGIRDAYEDLFRIKTNANALTRAELEGKLRSLTQGKLSDNVLKLTVKTFTELVKQADFSAEATAKPEKPDAAAETTEEAADVAPVEPPPLEREPARPHRSANRAFDALAYRIEVVLPATRDKLIYDAIFRSLREHLL